MRASEKPWVVVSAAGQVVARCSTEANAIRAMRRHEASSPAFGPYSVEPA